MAWWSRPKKALERTPQEGAAPAPVAAPPADEKKSVPKGIWLRCDSCNEILFGPDLEANLRVCPKCQHHFALPTGERIRMLVDEGSFVEEDEGLDPTDPLEFKDSKKYKDRLKTTRKVSGHNEAYRAGRALMGGRPVELGLFAFEFMGGSMGSVVGEKIARQFERAIERKCPAIVLSASGGARMQEGVLSLMQMAKTSAALARLRAKNLPYISVMLNPTTGGVAASFAMLGDLAVAEPKALIGFAGPRVIEQTIRQKLPEGFQRSEFLLERGMLDAIVHRHELRAWLIQVITLMMADARVPEETSRAVPVAASATASMRRAEPEVEDDTAAADAEAEGSEMAEAMAATVTVAVAVAAAELAATTAPAAAAAAPAAVAAAVNGGSHGVVAAAPAAAAAATPAPAVKLEAASSSGNGETTAASGDVAIKPASPSTPR